MGPAADEQERMARRTSRRRRPDTTRRHHRPHGPRPLRRHVPEKPSGRRQTAQGRAPGHAIRQARRSDGTGHRPQRRRRQPHEIPGYPKHHQTVPRQRQTGDRHGRRLFGHGRTNHRQARAAVGHAARHVECGRGGDRHARGQDHHLCDRPMHMVGGRPPTADRQTSGRLHG